MPTGAIGVESKKSFVIVEVLSAAVPIPVEVSITLVIVPLKPYFTWVHRKTVSREPLQPTIDLWRRVRAVPGIRHLRALRVVSAIEVFQRKRSYWWRGLLLLRKDFYITKENCC